ncbi:MAG: hypothetical protein ABI862_01110 [Ilumatobacteraceae bacterium]
MTSVVNLDVWVRSAPLIDTTRLDRVQVVVLQGEDGRRPPSGPASGEGLALLVDVVSNDHGWC